MSQHTTIAIRAENGEWATLNDLNETMQSMSALSIIEPGSAWKLTRAAPDREPTSTEIVLTTEITGDAAVRAFRRIWSSLRKRDARQFRRSWHQAKTQPVSFLKRHKEAA